MTLTFTEIWYFPSPGAACVLAADVFVLGRTMLSLTLPISAHNPICARGARFGISAASSPGGSCCACAWGVGLPGVLGDPLWDRRI